MKVSKKFLVLALTKNEGEVPQWVQLLPMGTICPNGVSLCIDEKSINDMLEEFKKRENDIVLDYEHQTLEGVEAPAAGWIVDLEGRADGLWGKIEWTDRGREYIKKREYRYISPVVLFDKDTRMCTKLLSAALTNDPAIDGMKPVAAKENGGENTMEFLTKLAELLGLSPDATEDEVLEAIQGMIHQEDEVPEELAEVLELEEGEATISAAKRKIYALKAGRVPAGDFAAVNRQLSEMRAEKTIEIAMKDGKITPAQKSWAMKQATKDPKGFEEFLRTTPCVVPMSQINSGPVARGSRISDQQREVNKKLRINDKDFTNYGGR